MCTVGAIVIHDLTLIFGIIAGLAECSTVFVLPSIFYLKACHMEHKAHEQAATPQASRRRLGGGVLMRAGVYIYLLLGLIYFCVSNYFNFAKMMR